MSSAGAVPFPTAPASSSAAGAAAAAAAVAGAGPPLPAPASSAAAAVAAAAGAPAGSVFVKRAGDARARFAEVEIFETDTVTRLAERASLKLDWRTTAAYVDLFLIKPAGGEHAFATPTQAQIDTVLADEGNVLGEGMPLLLAGIASGAWVVARLSSPPAAAPSECARAARSLLSRSPSWGSGGARGTCERFRWVFVGRSPLFRQRFHSFYPLQAAAAAAAAAAVAATRQVEALHQAPLAQQCRCLRLLAHFLRKSLVLRCATSCAAFVLGRRTSATSSRGRRSSSVARTVPSRRVSWTSSATWRATLLVNA